MPLTKKMPLIILAIVTLALALLGTANFIMQRKTILDFYSEKALDLATSMAIFIDGDTVESALKTETKNSQYDHWKNIIDRMLTENNLTYLYVMSPPTGDSLSYYLSADDRDGAIDFLEREDLSEFDGLFLSIYETGERATYSVLFESEKYGLMVSGYAPVKNSSGKVVAIVGADIDMQEVKDRITLYGLAILALSAVLSIVVFLISVRIMRSSFIRPLNTLVEAANNFSITNKSFKDLNFDKHSEFKVLAETLQNMEQKINKAVRKSFTDPLTKINNREFFNIEVNNYLKANLKTRENLTDGSNIDEKLGAFFIIDIDYFKQVNDKFGHEKGDTVIRSVAKVLLNAFDSGKEVVARIGGDEFAVFSPLISGEDYIDEKCKKIKELIKEVKCAENEAPVTLSIGVAMFRHKDDDSTFSELFNRADNALYDVKAGGRNGYRIICG